MCIVDTKLNGRFQCLLVYVYECVRISSFGLFFCVVFIFVLLKFIQVHRNDPTNVSMQIILNWWTVMIPAFQWLDWSVDSECFVDQLLCVCCVCAQIILFQKKKNSYCAVAFLMQFNRNIFITSYICTHCHRQYTIHKSRAEPSSSH